MTKLKEMEFHMDLFEFDFSSSQSVTEVTNPTSETIEDIVNACPSKRTKANLQALKLLKVLGGNQASEAERSILADFTGWGGIHEIFDAKHKEYGTLKNFLSENEYRAAKNTILDAFYTPKSLIREMWQLAADHGYKGGKCLEPGAGSGNFMAAALKNSRFTAIEVDNISAGILKKVYPDSDIRHDSLEDIKLTQTYDLAIGNVPYGKTGLYDRNYPKYNLHNYFIARSLDALKDQGLVVLLTSSATLDSADTTARECFAKKAGLIEAIRLPNNTFNGTQIVSDILIFKKGAKGDSFIKLKEIQTGDETGTMLVNEYFADHPDKIRGIPSNTGRMYGRLNTPTVLPE